MSNTEPAVNALITGISNFLGPPTSTVKYVVRWSVDGFDVVIQQDVGPHVWLSDRWRPTGDVFNGLSIVRYAPGQPRISNLGPMNAPTLTKEHAAHRISFVSDRVGTTVAAVRACAVVAGIRVS